MQLVEKTQKVLSVKNVLEFSIKKWFAQIYSITRMAQVEYPSFNK